MRRKGVPKGFRVEEVVAVVPRDNKPAAIEGGYTYKDDKPLDMRVLQNTVEGYELHQVYYAGQWLFTERRNWEAK
jgi:hypothetical protein